MNRNRMSRLYRQLLVSTLLLGGAFNMAAPILAAGTPAGQSISNTATATYDDDNDPNNGQFNATSNTVTIKVAEIAGINIDTTSGYSEAPNTVANAGPNQGNNVIDTGDVVYFDYNITNVGNDTTQFHIPGAPSQILGGTLSGQIQIIAVNGTALGTPVNVPTAGDDTKTLLSSVPGSGVFAPGGTVRIRVPIKVTANTSGAPIKVLLGDTPPNDNDPVTTQNQPYAAGTGDVYTKDDPAETNGNLPTASEREASAFQQTFLNATPKAFVVVTKTNSNFQAGASGTTSPNGVLTYNLGLEVKNSSPDSAFTAADLQGTKVNVDGADRDNIVLLSDAVPTGTTLVAPVAAPTGWKAVYSIDDPATKTALQASWYTSPTDPAIGANAIKRVGFIHDVSTTAPITTGNPGAITKGSPVTNFSFQVKTTGAAGQTIYNLAQVFGQTTPGSGNTLAYDESGDQNPNNYNGSAPGPNSNITPTDFNTSPSTNEKGVADPSQGIDNGNNNQGQGDEGEVNPFTIPSTTIAQILNGPDGHPGAYGPTDQNDDFTNKSTPVPANSVTNNTASGTFTFDPAEITFTNTVKNPNPNVAAPALTNVLLRPIAPTNAADLPSGTKVTITLGVNTGVYEYTTTTTGGVTTGDFAFKSGTPISIASLSSVVALTYTVKVDLPTGTRLSTDLNRGFPVPIVSYTDNDGSGTFNAGDVSNITIDRVYTGYLKMIKDARILDKSGTQVAPAGPGPSYTSNTSLLDAAALPGNTIEYRISYKNISEPPSGSNNVTLQSIRTLITEDGSAGGNTWFGLTLDPIYPNQPNGSATATNGSISVTADSGDIKIYVNNVGIVEPRGSAGADNGSFIFQRKIK